MTEKARELGLTNTSYADPSGLLSDNVSSAYDLAKLITYVSGDERIASDDAEADLLGRGRPSDDPGAQHQPARDAG